MKKDKYKKSEEVYKEVKKRAADMYLQGHPPKTDWWLERLEEGLAKVCDDSLIS